MIDDSQLLAKIELSINRGFTLWRTPGWFEVNRYRVRKLMARAYPDDQYMIEELGMVRRDVLDHLVDASGKAGKAG